MNPHDTVLTAFRRRDLSRLDGFVVKHDELRRFQREHCVRPAVVATEFNFKDVWSERFHNGADLTPHKTAFWQVVR